MTIDEISLPNCDTCPEGVKTRATHKCIECSDWLCGECAQFHRRTKLTRGHLVLTLEQIKSGKHDEEIRNRAKVFCQVHLSEETRLFCLDCNLPVCQLCECYQQHKVILIKDAMADKLADFEESLGDVHRKAELLRAELKHMTRIEEQLMQEKNKALRESQIIAQDAHSAIDSWHERIVLEINSQFNHDSENCQEKREVLTCRDRQLRRCGDFIARVVQIGTPSEIIQLQRAKNAIENLLSTSNIEIPSNSTAYHVNQAERLMDIDLGTFEIVQPEISMMIKESSPECPKLPQTVELKRPESIHSSGSDSGITEEPPRLPPKKTPRSQSISSTQPSAETHEVLHLPPKSASSIKKSSPEPAAPLPMPPTKQAKQIVLRNPSVRLLMKLGDIDKDVTLGSSPVIEVSQTGEIFLLDLQHAKLIIYNQKGKLLRHFKFALKGVPFEPTSFCLYGDKLALTYEDSLVLASPIDGHILKYFQLCNLIIKLFLGA